MNGKQEDTKNESIFNATISSLVERIDALIIESRKRVVTAVNTAMVYTYYEIGRYLVEEEQGGKTRAEYGKAILKGVSAQLTQRWGKGWSYENLVNMRRFFLSYTEMPIPKRLLDVSQKIVNSGYNIELIDSVNSGYNIDKHAIRATGYAVRPFVLPWSHYMVLSHVDNPEARAFYEIEAFEQQWSKRYLQRQIGSGLYERLALSRDKSEVMRLATEGQVVAKPDDIIKDPLVLEFVGLKPDASYSETDLESAIINRLQDFLLEMGKGFLFEARQKRFTFEERNFYVDLVLYNRLLQCYVLVDLKMDDLTHQDLGQMQMYVNYYDRYVKTDFEKPTIGILLCERKSGALVELTLPNDAHIYAQQYALYLPDKETLQRKLREWIDEQDRGEEK